MAAPMNTFLGDRFFLANFLLLEAAFLLALPALLRPTLLLVRLAAVRALCSAFLAFEVLMLR